MKIQNFELQKRQNTKTIKISFGNSEKKFAMKDCLSEKKV
jgi:hypothetical protein